MLHTEQSWQPADTSVKESPAEPRLHGRPTGTSAEKNQLAQPLTPSPTPEDDFSHRGSQEQSRTPAQPGLLLAGLKSCYALHWESPRFTFLMATEPPHYGPLAAQSTVRHRAALVPPPPSTDPTEYPPIQGRSGAPTSQH